MWRSFDRKGKMISQTQFKNGEDVKALMEAKAAEDKAKKAAAAKKAAEKVGKGAPPAGKGAAATPPAKK